jgi:hypothetical protein
VARQEDAMGMANKSRSVVLALRDSLNILLK